MVGRSKIISFNWYWCWPPGGSVWALFFPCGLSNGLLHFPHACTLSCSVTSDSAALWTVAHQAPLSMGFSRQEYWCGLSFPFPEDLPDPGIKPVSPALQIDFLLAEP